MANSLFRTLVEIYMNDKNILQKRIISWFFLIGAIMLEVIGVSMLKAIANPIVGNIVMIVFVNLSYVLMAFALLGIALGVAYSVWEILGLVGIIVVSFVFFEPELTTYQYVGIVLGFLGIVCVIMGEKHKDCESMQDSCDEESVPSVSSHNDTSHLKV